MLLWHKTESLFHLLVDLCVRYEIKGGCLYVAGLLHEQITRILSDSQDRKTYVQLKSGWAYRSSTQEAFTHFYVKLVTTVPTMLDRLGINHIQIGDQYEYTLDPALPIYKKLYADAYNELGPWCCMDSLQGVPVTEKRSCPQLLQEYQLMQSQPLYTWRKVGFDIRLLKRVFDQIILSFPKSSSSYFLPGK
jgi:hypothetical protein